MGRKRGSTASAGGLGALAGEWRVDALVLLLLVVVFRVQAGQRCIPRGLGALAGEHRFCFKATQSEWHMVCAKRHAYVCGDVTGLGCAAVRGCEHAFATLLESVCWRVLLRNWQMCIFVHSCAGSVFLDQVPAGKASWVANCWQRPKQSAAPACDGLLLG